MLTYSVQGILSINFLEGIFRCQNASSEFGVALSVPWKYDRHLNVFAWFCLVFPICSSHLRLSFSQTHLHSVLLKLMFRSNTSPFGEPQLPANNPSPSRRRGTDWLYVSPHPITTVWPWVNISRNFPGKKQDCIAIRDKATSIYSLIFQSAYVATQYVTWSRFKEGFNKNTRGKLSKPSGQFPFWGCARRPEINPASC